MHQKVSYEDLLREDAVHGSVYQDPDIIADEMDHITRLLEGKAFAQSPQSRLRRIIGNIEISEGTDIWQVETNFIMMEVRDHIQRLHGGRSQYQLLQDGDEIRIKAKKVLLVGIDEHQESVSFLI